MLISFRMTLAANEARNFVSPTLLCALLTLHQLMTPNTTTATDVQYVAR